MTWDIIDNSNNNNSDSHKRRVKEYTETYVRYINNGLTKYEISHKYTKISELIKDYFVEQNFNYEIINGDLYLHYNRKIKIVFYDIEKHIRKLSRIRKINNILNE